MNILIGKKTTGINIVPALTSLVVGLGIWMIPTPEGVTQNAWQLFAIFIATILGIILKVLPMGAMALLSLTILSITQTLSIQEVLGGFGNKVVWLILMAFFVAKSFVKSGLGMRIAYIFVGLLGKKSLGLAYGMALTDLVLSPAIPSITARCGGIIFPLIKSLSITFGSTPEKKTERYIGSYLIQCAYHVNCITSAIFLTSMAANPMLAGMAEDIGIHLSWGQWAIAASLPAAISLILTPWVLFKLYPPEIRETPKAPQIAKDHLKKMGAMSNGEKTTLGIFFLLLFLWIFGSSWGIDSTSAAFAGVSILIMTGVLSWQDIISEKPAWNALFWFSALIMMASNLSKLGIIGWISSSIQENVEMIEWYWAFPILILTYFYSHYLFASSTAHISSMFAAFAMVGIVTGVPPLVMVYSLAFASSLSACLTHYGAGPAPILYGAGYVDLVDWWKLGALMSIMHIIVWFGLGMIWWYVIGLW